MSLSSIPENLNLGFSFSSAFFHYSYSGAKYVEGQRHHNQRDHRVSLKLYGTEPKTSSRIPSYHYWTLLNYLFQRTENVDQVNNAKKLRI